ncbi:protein adenylyltransferase SelO, mitochondrial-like [Oscarella lobularis]|uniref:protein adenylyltransferase SelO, mitochondrial-like n=1 Tax=Oscarella lobularis TaxID=121494 RepID=UPI0033131F4F
MSRILRSYLRFASTMSTLETLNFDNTCLKSLPIDEVAENYVRTVAGACFSRVRPTPVRNPRTVAVSRSALDLIDLNDAETDRDDFADYFSGGKLFPGAEPAAHCYCGHQFGNFAGQLGDGAAMYLGEVVNRRGERWEVQFKGSGKTPYSRTADGRKVLRSSIREFLCSEAIHNLGIPTTRAGACVTSDTMIPRDINYTGNPIEERVTIVTRIAPSFIRFGSFEIFKTRDPLTGRSGPSVGRKDILVTLLDYVISAHYPEIKAAHSDDVESRYAVFFRAITSRTIDLVVHWQSVGFCHGVLNTDNMSILGLTIDYGPFGFMDRFDPNHICNSSDNNGRYTYRKQPGICLWNLERLADALAPVLSREKSAEELKRYEKEFEIRFLKKMKQKLGLESDDADDSDLIDSLFETMHATGADFTNTFRCLSRLKLPGTSKEEEAQADVLTYLLSQCSSPQEMLASEKSMMDPRQLHMLLQLAQQNPQILELLGGSLAQLEAEKNRQERVSQLEKLTPEEKSAKDHHLWNDWLEKYRLRVSKEVSTAGDLSVDELQEKRVRLMNSHNPRFILRNYIAQNAIKKAEEGDFSEVKKVLERLENPYDDSPADVAVSKPTDETFAEKIPARIAASYDTRPPVWALGLTVS